MWVEADVSKKVPGSSNYLKIGACGTTALEGENKGQA